MVLPIFDQNGNFPPGIHSCTWEEAISTLAFNARRQEWKSQGNSRDISLNSPDLR